MRIVLCYLMASHCNPMAFNLRIPTFIEAFLRVFRWIVHYASMQFRHLLYKQEGWGLPGRLGATRRVGGYKPLAESLQNFNQNYKRLNLFWVGPESKRGWAILKFAIQQSSSTTSRAVVHLLKSTIVSNSFYCVECIHHTLAMLPTSHNYWLIFANQLWADHFGTWLIAKLFYLVDKKLRTCGADFKNYEVADLRLRIQESWNVVADLRLRIKKIEICLRICGLKKKLAVPSTGF